MRSVQAERPTTALDANSKMLIILQPCCTFMAKHFWTLLDNDAMLDIRLQLRALPYNALLRR